MGPPRFSRSLVRHRHLGGSAGTAPDSVVSLWCSEEEWVELDQVAILKGMSLPALVLSSVLGMRDSIVEKLLAERTSTS